MARVFLLALVVVLMVGCVAIPVGRSNGGMQLFIMYQVGMVVRVVNNCAPFLDLETVNGVLVQGLPYGSSVTVPMVSEPFSGSYRQMSLTAKGYTANREYLGSLTATFQLSTYDGSRSAVWEVDHLRLPNGRGGCR